MKKYPYIGKGLLGSVVLFTDNSFGVAIKHENKKWEGVCRGGWNESIFTDITREYLQNTWGAVESKEHADYIIELAELHGFKVWRPSDGLARVTHFVIYGGEIKMHSHNCASAISNMELKKVMIPLMPQSKVDDMFEKESELHKSIADNLELEPNSKQIAAISPPKVKEEYWPNVGGEAVSIYSDKVCGEIMAIGIDNICFKLDSGNLVVMNIGEVKKPKSKQDILTEELQAKLCNNNYVDNFTLASDIINGMIPGLSYNSDIESAVKGVINNHLDGDV